MGYKSILVQVDDGSDNTGAQATAARLAARFDGHLTGLCVYEPTYYRHPLAYQAGLPDFVEQRRGDKDDAIRERATAEFETVCRSHGVERFESRFVKGERLSSLCLNARYADVVVLSQAEAAQSGRLQQPPDPDLAAKVAMASARPIIEVFAGDAIEQLGQRILVAWNASPQATRAVTAALPLLREAERVEIIIVNPDTDNRYHGPEPGADIVLYLSRHGVSVDTVQTENNVQNVSATLMAYAGNMRADLICMGAYGHSRLRELILGGVTRELTRKLELPILMAH